METCRVCLKYGNEDLTLIYMGCDTTDTGSSEKTYFQMYQYISGVAPSKTLSMFICSNCSEALKISCSLKEKIELNERVANNMVVIKTENEFVEDCEEMIMEPSIEIFHETDADPLEEAASPKLRVPSWKTWYKYNKNDEDEEIQCVLCSYKTSKKCNFQKHIERVHKRVRMKCDGCDESYHLIYILERHRQIDHGFFHKYVVDKSLLSSPVEDVKSGELSMIECPLCDYKSTSKDNYGKHVKRTHNRQSLQCDGCQESFHLVHVLLQHRKVKHQFFHQYKVHEKSSKSSKKETTTE